MEARAAVRGTGISKTLIAVVLVLVAIGLGAMGAYLAANLGANASTQTQLHQGASGPVQVYRPVRSGAQTDDSGPVSATPGFDARSIREGHGP